MAIALRRENPTVATRPQRAAHVTAEHVWQELDKASFAVIGYTTPTGESRSSGVVYGTVGNRLFFVVAPDSWKARHIASSHQVSVTVPVRRGGLLALLMPIPPATISFHATAIVHPAGQINVGGLSKELESLLPKERRDAAVVIEAIPQGEFLVYGIGVPLLSMRQPELARAVVPVNDHGGALHRAATPGFGVYALMGLVLAGGLAGIWLPQAGIVAVVALLAATIGASKTAIPHRATRIAMLVVESFIAVTAIQGGAGLLRDSFGLSSQWLAGSLFSDYLVPGLALLVLVGGGSVIAAATVFIERSWAAIIAGIAGILMAGYEVVEIVSIDGNVGNDLPIVLAAQLVWFMAGVGVAVLAATIWIREYRGGHNNLVRHAKEARAT